MSSPRASLRTSSAAWREILRTSHTLLRQFEEAGDFAPATVREYDVLLALAESPGREARLGALATDTSLPQPTMSRLVERMERSGWVSRCPSPQDGRGTLVRLTDEGLAIQAAIGRRHLRSIHAAMTADLTTEELLQLADLLRRVRTGAVRKATA